MISNENNSSVGKRTQSNNLIHDGQTRLNFVKKVFGILTAQLLFTSMFCLLAVQTMAMKSFLHSPALMVPVMILYFISFCALACCGLDRAVPVNYVLLGVFTYCVSHMVGFICTQYDPTIVIEAALLTCAMTSAITYYGMTSKTDYTLCAPVLFIMGFVFFTFFLIGALAGFHLRLLYCCLGVILFSFYLLVDIQMIMGGNNKWC